MRAPLLQCMRSCSACTRQARQPAANRHAAPNRGTRARHPPACQPAARAAQPPPAYGRRRYAARARARAPGPLRAAAAPCTLRAGKRARAGPRMYATSAAPPAARPAAPRARRPGRGQRNTLSLPTRSRAGDGFRAAARPLPRPAPHPGRSAARPRCLRPRARRPGARPRRGARAPFFAQRRPATATFQRPPAGLRPPGSPPSRSTAPSRPAQQLRAGRRGARGPPLGRTLGRPLAPPLAPAHAGCAPVFAQPPTVPTERPPLY